MLAGFLSVEDPGLCRDLSLGEVMLKAGWRLQIPACGGLEFRQLVWTGEKNEGC